MGLLEMKAGPVKIQTWNEICRPIDGLRLANVNPFTLGFLLISALIVIFQPYQAWVLLIRRLNQVSGLSSLSFFLVIQYLAVAAIAFGLLERAAQKARRRPLCLGLIDIMVCR